MAGQTRNKILLVDDDAELHELVRFVLTRDGYEVTDAFDAAEGLEMLARDDFDLAMIDVMMPGMSGLQLLERMRAARQDLPAILMTGVDRAQIAVSAGSNCAVLAKPFDIDELRRVVRLATGNAIGNASAG